MSKFSKLPLQHYVIYGFKGRSLSRWMKGYRLKRARGVWVQLGYSTGKSPWEATARFRKSLPSKGLYYTLKAMPTWKRAVAPQVQVTQTLDKRTRKWFEK